MEGSKKKISTEFTLKIILIIVGQIALLFAITSDRATTSDIILFSCILAVFTVSILYILTRPKFYYDAINVYIKSKGKFIEIPFKNIHSIRLSSFSLMRWYDLYRITYTLDNESKSVRLFTSCITNPMKGLINSVQNDNSKLELA